jgi:hypothetical protein
LRVNMGSESFSACAFLASRTNIDRYYSCQDRTATVTGDIYM